MTQEGFVISTAYMSNTLFILLFAFISSSAFSQNHNREYIRSYENLRKRNIHDLTISMSSIEINSLAYKCLNWEKKMLLKGENDSNIHDKILTTKLKGSNDSILYELHNAEYFISSNNQEKAYSHYQNALKKAQEQSDSLFVCKSLYSLLQLTTRNKKLTKLSENYIRLYFKYAYNNLEKSYANYYKFYFKTNQNRTFNPDSINHELQLANNSGSDFSLLEYYQRIGVGYDVFLKKPDSAIKYYNKSIEIIERFQDFHFIKQRKKGILNNLGCIHYDQENYDLALSFFNEAEKIKSTNRRLLNDSVILSWKLKIHKKKNNLDSIIHYYELQDSINQKLSQQKYALKIDELDRKYNISEKEKLNLILKNQIDKKQREQRVLWVSSISLLIIGSSIGALLYKNTKRKQRIAEQEKEIEIQKTEKLLKDQELAAIDAMILGQEKERQRLANDLHDNLGSTLATVKLHFQHLKSNWNNPKVKNIEELYTNTDHLLDEAYQKVRTIAHEKNSGVMANQGLLVAIKNLAKKVSNSNKIQVEVQDFGLEERLDNSLEISIFRMIQELITNCIKHAEANEIHISLTNHDSLLNIIIEDNGKGFDPKTIIDKDGMGLKTIEKRIEHLEGTFEIDSTPNQGTNIIINIPI